MITIEHYNYNSCSEGTCLIITWSMCNLFLLFFQFCWIDLLSCSCNGCSPNDSMQMPMLRNNQGGLHFCLHNSKTCIKCIRTKRCVFYLIWRCENVIFTIDLLHFHCLRPCPACHRTWTYPRTYHCTKARHRMWTSHWTKRAKGHDHLIVERAFTGPVTVQSGPTKLWIIRSKNKKCVYLSKLLPYGCVK